jgi:hypothetical protein
VVLAFLFLDVRVLGVAVTAVTASAGSAGRALGLLGVLAVLGSLDFPCGLGGLWVVYYV